ncbi:MAG: hypothetical protein FJW26_02460 [Acidimicrobiia bacterium]|nr:hypothetical protein [Acidimicrobiia bacterium]
MPHSQQFRFSRWWTLPALILMSGSSGWTQQRPLETQEPAILPAGMVSLQFGFDFLQNAKFPLPGLRGDLTSLGVIGIYTGLGGIAEFQMQGTVFNSLSINQRSPTPLSLKLNSGGTATSDFGDLSLSTKILLVPEKKHFPALAFRPTVQLPNASAAKGLGLDSTQFYGTLLAGKHFGKLNAFANAGLGILSNPVQAGAQNDVVVYGLGGIYPLTAAANLASEVYGRWNTRKEGAPLGTESQSLFRLGVQITGLGFRWDIAGVAGLANNSPHSGITFGVTKEFRAFGARKKKN